MYRMNREVRPLQMNENTYKSFIHGFHQCIPPMPMHAYLQYIITNKQAKHAYSYIRKTTYNNYSTSITKSEHVIHAWELHGLLIFNLRLNSRLAATPVRTCMSKSMPESCGCSCIKFSNCFARPQWDVSQIASTDSTGSSKGTYYVTLQMPDNCENHWFLDKISSTMQAW